MFLYHQHEDGKSNKNQKRKACSITTAQKKAYENPIRKSHTKSHTVGAAAGETVGAAVGETVGKSVYQIWLGQ